MKVVDGKFGESKKEDATASDALQAFADMMSEVEEQYDTPCEAAIIVLSPEGLTVGGNVLNPEGIYYLLGLGMQSIMNAGFGMGDYDDTVH